MSRKPRVSIVGVPQHVIQRGNNRQAIFNNDEDRQAYITWLKDAADKFNVEIHAWVLMTNHVHLLCTPQAPAAISLMMQSLGRRYVQYFNRRYERTGTLWEGRFKSSLVQSEMYLLEVYRYIELNPVRAGMVADPANYPWSSYINNALGKETSLLKSHPLYLNLGTTTQQRQERYRALFKLEVKGSELKGSESFKTPNDSDPIC
ncbi:MAG TPA: transposase [Marinospirillum sp.]|uniref:REP-associated tyrosine transposase n=1 Tax=Marinospirillum sp. TaxID=2183934 RepID=UPI002B4A9549|nr:transposase [Marinospirillum sp.]HKM14472.1 transposase [Marinospirillum sp.]